MKEGSGIGNQNYPIKNTIEMFTGRQFSLNIFEDIGNLVLRYHCKEGF